MYNDNLSQPSSVPPKTNTLGLISMILGIISALLFIPSFCIACLGWLVILLGGAAAVLGFMAKKQIDESNGTQGGRGMAMAGLIIGLITAGIMLLITIIYLIFGLGAIGLSTIPFLSELNF